MEERIVTDPPLFLIKYLHFWIHHNFVRPHMGLDGKTPAEVCGIPIQGNNKWITLIQNASRKQRK